jgi:hypothetical protein
MPRNSTRPEAVLALSPTATARALGIRYDRVAAAILAGALTVRVCGGKQRIAVREIEKWFLSWPRKVPK